MVAAVAAAAVVVVAAEAAVEDVGDNATNVMRETKMKLRLRIMTSSKFTLLASAIASFCLLGSGLHAAPASNSEAASAPQPSQKQFDTPKQAADALVQVATNLDVAAAKEILGPDGEDLINSEDPVMDKKRATEFADKA